jgi:hypothetical protein
MRKAIIVPDLAYTSRKGNGKTGGHQQLKAKLKYLQFRDDRDGHIPQEQGLERWENRGLGRNYREILKNCDQLSTRNVMAWTWVISPDPILMSLVPEPEREALVKHLTEEIVEAYYTSRGAEVPQYSYVMHDRLTNESSDRTDRLQQLHTHVVLPATVPTLEGVREPFYNRASQGHLQLLRDLSTEKFAAALDHHIGPEWRTLGAEPEVEQAGPILGDPDLSELDRWFGPRDIE